MGDNNNYTFGAQQICHDAQIGVSIEPISNIPETPPATTNHINFAQKMLENLFNYIASYAISQSQMVPNPTENYVPLSTLQTWYTNFERRMITNPNFWKT